MPEYKFYTKRQLVEALSIIGDAVYAEVAPLEIEAWCSSEPLAVQDRCSGNRRVLAVGDIWGDLFDCAWFHFTGEIPAGVAGQHVVLLLDVNGEMCVFDADGVPVRGLTPVSSSYDYSLGVPGKRVLEVTDAAQGGEPIDVWADAGYNDLFGNVSGNGTVRQAAIAVCNDEVRDLYYDFEVLLDFLHTLPEDSPRYHQVLTGLTDVTHILYEGLSTGAAKARALLKPLLAQRGGDPSLEISAVGHAHMDLAWLWPIRETLRKGARTFATAIDLADRYPDYIFGASQPQYFQWMKESYPELYQKIKAKVREGRLEPQGAMWVEADTNITGGEALVRQLLLGKGFFKEEFDVDIDYLWLPDVFGYTAALPQILSKAAVTTFFTQKLSWSLINVFPHHAFKWQGIDGTQVLAKMFPEETYNSPAAPRSVRRIETNYKDKGISHYSLMVYGIGDGGGGPGEEHLERLRRIRNLAGLSPVKLESTADFHRKWREEAARFPTWVGELYLERHEGTLTTQARNKWYNRKMELGLRGLEWRSVVGRVVAGQPYPVERLTDIWREVLLYQFHDILPGSSIRRVYEESVARYDAMYAEVTALSAERETAIAASVDTHNMASPVIVHNDLSWARSEWVPVGDLWAFAEVPPMGYITVDVGVPAPEIGVLKATSSHLENDHLTVAFGEDGSIVSLFNKRLKREFIPEGERANRLLVFADLGDAWDFPMDYAEQSSRAMKLVASEPRIDGPRAILKQTYQLGSSELVQEIILTSGSSRLDFVTELNWRETRAMLRSQFPVAVRADEATYEIQFGHLRRPTHRNTTWDLARDEVAAHKWVDLSQRDFGIALLNDSKYGHKIKGNVIDLNLLRSVPYPGANREVGLTFPVGEPHLGFTDQRDHTFTYALYPHAGDPVEGGVIEEAYALNVPLVVTPVTPQRGTAPRCMSWLELSTPNVVIEAVKQAEDGEDIIVRLYEATGGCVDAVLGVNLPVAAASEADLMESPLKELALNNGALSLSFQPFEIKTVRLTLSV